MHIRTFQISADGDYFEKKGYGPFLQTKLPSYESFWQSFIVPITNRSFNVHDIGMKTDEDLNRQFPSEHINKAHERVIIAQLHYSAFRMMLRAYECIPNADTEPSTFEMFFSSIYSALDISAELFGRYARFRSDKIIFADPFDPQGAEKESKKIRKGWQQKHKYPKDINELRTYRNLMVHGHLFGVIQNPDSGCFTYPKPEIIKSYLDWRSVKSANKSHIISDFLSGKLIAERSFDLVINNLEKLWQDHLINCEKS